MKDVRVCHLCNFRERAVYVRGSREGMMKATCENVSCVTRERNIKNGKYTNNWHKDFRKTQLQVLNDARKAVGLPPKKSMREQSSRGFSGID